MFDGGSEVDGWTTIKLSRKLVTGDATQDRPFTCKHRTVNIGVEYALL